MTQFGMQMPGGRGRGGAGLDVYTGLLFAAVLALVAACVVAYLGASAVGPDGNAFAIQDPDRIQLKD